MATKEENVFRVVTARLEMSIYRRLLDKAKRRKRSLNFMISEAIEEMLNR